MVELGSADFWTRVQSEPARLAAEVCTIDVANLDRTLEQHAALRAWVNATYEVARISVERAEWELTKARATILLRVKAIVDPDTGKAKTMGVIDAEVVLSEEVQKATEDLRSVQERCVVLKAMSNALEDRRDMLIQIAAKQRKELEDYNR